MRIKPVLATVCAAALALTASSAPAAEPQSNTVAKDKPKAEKKICRWLPVTGSNMNQKVCLTAEDWKKAEALSW
jgi:hypothetical protein